MVHGVSKTHPLSEGLASVRSFLSNTQEIILWNGGYYGFGLNDGGQMPPEAHQELQAALEDAFGPWWVTPSGGWDMTLEQIWTQEGLAPGQGRILLHYGNSDNFDPSLDFPGRPGYFGDILFPEDMKPHLDDSIADAEANGYPRYSLSCQMTPRQAQMFPSGSLAFLSLLFFSKLCECNFSFILLPLPAFLLLPARTS